jgi:TPR repeat protein
MDTEVYYPCCGKSICRGCHYSSWKFGNDEKCPFCNTERMSVRSDEGVKSILKRVEANDAGAIFLLAHHYYRGGLLQQDRAKAMELYSRSANLGYSAAHNNLAGVYEEGGDLKKEKFHYEAAAMLGHELARFNLGVMEANSGNMERAVKHWTIGASAGCFRAMHELITNFGLGCVSRELIDSTLGAYNNSCVEMRNEARDAYICTITE